jgi:energy-coupling factor transport system ATP-binding protein
LDGFGVETKAGELIAILGQNGSGKSTLAKHFNALLPLQSGKLIVVGIDSRDKDNTWRLRRLCGMVFQSPDNQFVSSVIGEDVAFGLENYETPRFLIQGKVSSALKAVGMEGYEKRSPHTLSGGQKQRVALAGILALEPDIIVFDEATAMLDPEGRSEILNEIQRIRNQSQKTIVMITHHVEEAVLADRVYLMQKGKMLACGTPREILVDIELMELAGLIPPVPVRMYYDLKAAGILLKSCPLTDDELVEEICQLN